MVMYYVIIFMFINTTMTTG